MLVLQYMWPFGPFVKENLIDLIWFDTHHLLPEQTTHKHQLRTRRHDRQLLCKSKFDDSNFITRLLLKGCY